MHPGSPGCLPQPGSLVRFSFPTLLRLGASFDKDRKTVYLVFPVTGWDTEGVTVGLPLPLLLGPIPHNSLLDLYFS